MSEIELYKYINDNDIEWHHENNAGNPDVIIFPYIFQMQEFSDLVKEYDSDGGIQIILKNGYVAIWMSDLCDYFGIKLEKVFPCQYEEEI